MKKNNRFGLSYWALMAVCLFALPGIVAAGEAGGKDNNVDTVPPQGIAPFDPKPLMAALNERIKTDTFRFAVLGDAKHATTLPVFLKYLDETIHPDFVLTTGDMVRSGGGKVGPGYYEMLTEEAGPAMRKRAWWPAIGNHELAGDAITGKDALQADSEPLRKNLHSGSENFKKFYSLDNDYYSFTFRNCCFIALPFPYPTGKQIDWLEGELKKASEAKQLIFVFNHCPFFTVGTKPKNEVPSVETPVTALFQKYGVKAVFSGHDHGYYRTVRSGIPYIISAGAGAPIYPGKRVAEALKEDVYYYGVPESFQKGSKKATYVLHKIDGTETVSEKPDQFMCVIDVDGGKVSYYVTTVKGEKWDEMILAK